MYSEPFQQSPYFFFISFYVTEKDDLSLTLEFMDMARLVGQ